MLQSNVRITDPPSTTSSREGIINYFLLLQVVIKNVTEPKCHIQHVRSPSLLPNHVSGLQASGHTPFSIPPSSCCLAILRRHQRCSPIAFPPPPCKPYNPPSPLPPDRRCVGSPHCLLKPSWILPRFLAVVSCAKPTTTSQAVPRGEPQIWS
uniref:Uncharacterized protein n=1 Tax=Oryza meridionalis TaxID=40149 RepID=A0A0E0DP87_9ORYZ